MFHVHLEFWMKKLEKGLFLDKDDNAQLKEYSISVRKQINTNISLFSEIVCKFKNYRNSRKRQKREKSRKKHFWGNLENGTFTTQPWVNNFFKAETSGNYGPHRHPHTSAHGEWGLDCQKCPVHLHPDDWPRPKKNSGSYAYAKRALKSAEF